MLAGPPDVEKKATLEELLSQKRRAEACKLLLEAIKLPTIKEPAELGQLLDNAYFQRNRSQLISDDVRLGRQIKKFINAGGLAGLREEYPNECVILESFDKIKSLFV
ncbi:hypothetical protein GPECTOR_36g4 [Gonium pectorale]|uniref:Uncharacterized protein n=1 Tax=Gonium pectorale TaxID=33097 RepID=A0A150GCM4_GONPE|nr:hypothetical protein GPECTOR_36g4 [Gonium pectorale]|eukprot:KXZ47315.1 hypothetical protein GPECTOR_36g4 [Gonium pectorale]